ncbi:MAG TPA: cysteine--tRNA ligase [Candidatus Nanoarchaeia archaeon]|nr:cysteine--tRNA ligase [Candidatus Nanoarchaeia archaeon]
MSMISLFNTLTKSVQPFAPIKKDVVSMYCCGPTVYNYAHIGNLRTYIFEDILRRTLEYNGYHVKHVMNITDVGHLTSDADEGEDKMLSGAKREGKTVWDIAKFYEKAFMSDIEKLNIRKPSIVCRATEHIKEMIEMIQKLEKNGHAYVAGGNVYYDVSTFPAYGDFARLNLEELNQSRVEEDSNKRNRHDFVLWFTKSKFEDQAMKWDSPWGTGYPGWHIECSAMSTKYLGDQFDIHCGGIDHVNVHHTNEIAQTEGATNKKPWVNYWLHGDFLVLEKEKMSKSAGTFLTMQSLIDKGYDPLDYRYFCLGAHYKTQLMFSFEALDAAKQAYSRLRNKVIELKKDQSSKNKANKTEYQKSFSDAISDDLNISKALGIVWELVKDDQLGNQEKLELIFDFDTVFGLKLREAKEEEIDVPEDVKQLAEQRTAAKKSKNFAESDRLRNLLAEKGFVIEDKSDGSYKIKKK